MVMDVVLARFDAERKGRDAADDERALVLVEVASSETQAAPSL